MFTFSTGVTYLPEFMSKTRWLWLKW